MKTVLKTAEEKMEKSLDAVARDFASVRAGRANPSVLDRVSVDYYGCPTPVNQMASVSVSEARVANADVAKAEANRMIRRNELE